MSDDPQNRLPPSTEEDPATLARRLKETEDELHTLHRLLDLVAHDLRNPVAALDLLVQGMLRQTTNPTRALNAEWLGPRAERMRRQVDRLAFLTESLHLARSLRTADQAQTIEGAVDLCEVIEEAVGHASEDLVAAGTSLTLELAPTTRRGDRQMLAGVVRSLLETCLLRAQGLALRVSLRDEAGTTWLRLHDAGGGERLGEVRPLQEEGDIEMLTLWTAQQMLRKSGGRVHLLADPGVAFHLAISLPPCQDAGRA